MGRRKLAFTSRTPGKTRTINVFDLAGRLYLVDLPGYGWAKLSRTERRRLSLLLRSYFAERDPAGLVWLLDIRRDPSPEDEELAAVVTERSLPTVVAFTKSDKLRWAQRLERVKAIREKLPVDLADSQWVVTSARTGEGISQLRAAIERLTGMEGLWK
ncbi:MAG: putative GTP-binding protein EngB [Gemmatimonadales bacterium]|nr:putative GTP-binding protein EngB [bacterium HR33]GIW52514.1 MAG: putative GTP-binding protein EngB [Gemmatimonadales bacterium]